MMRIRVFGFVFAFAVLAALGVSPVAALTKEVVVEKEIHFDLDKDRITPAAALVLEEAARFLRENPSSRIDIVGHTCDLASNPYNEKLALRRAKAAEKYLETKAKLLPEKVNVVARGEEAPKYDNADPGQKALNRRVEIRLVSVVEIPEPSVRISIDPPSILRGGKATLSWSSANASDVAITPDLGGVPLSGSREISPARSGGYTALATGEGGEASASAAITVRAPLPAVTLSAVPGRIIRGEESTLSWTSENATIVDVRPEPGSVAAYGAGSVRPEATTTYVAVARNDDGAEAVANATVIVDEPVAEEIRAAFVSVVDRDGRFIRDLRPGDFFVTQSGEPREVVRVVFEEQDFASSIALVLDKSASISSAMGDLRSAAKAFVARKKESDRVLVIGFSSDVRTYREFDADRRSLESAIDGILSGGSTRLYDALHLAASKMSGVEEPRVVVLMTDGVDEGLFGKRGSERTLESALETVAANSVQVFTVGFGSKLDRAMLERIATSTGGAAYFTTDPDELARIYEKLSTGLLRGMYRVEYRSPVAAPGGDAVDVLSKTGRVLRAK